MSKDKHTCTSIFSRRMEATALNILQLFCDTQGKIFTNSLLFTAWNVHFEVLSGTSS